MSRIIDGTFINQLTLLPQFFILLHRIIHSHTIHVQFRQYMHVHVHVHVHNTHIINIHVYPHIQNIHTRTHILTHAQPSSLTLCQVLSCPSWHRPATPSGSESSWSDHPHSWTGMASLAHGLDWSCWVGVAWGSQRSVCVDWQWLSCSGSYGREGSGHRRIHLHHIGERDRRERERERERERKGRDREWEREREKRERER